MLHCEARRRVRRGPDGRYIPLSEQDSEQWSLPLIEEAERNLAEASSRGRAERFQLEALIQSVHAERGRSGNSAIQCVSVTNFSQTGAPSPFSTTGIGVALESRTYSNIRIGPDMPENTRS
jgi:predicted RNA polymerase sigma factor